MKYLLWRNISQYMIVFCSIINLILIYIKKNKKYKKQTKTLIKKMILICSILIVITGFGLWYFNNAIQTRIENERDQANLDQIKANEKNQLLTIFFGSLDNKIIYVTLFLTFDPFPNCEKFSDLVIFFRATTLNAYFKIKGIKSNPATYSLTVTKTTSNNMPSSYSNFLIPIYNNQIDIGLYLGLEFDKEYTIRDFQSSFWEFFISSEFIQDLTNLKLVINKWIIFDRNVSESDFFVLKNLRNWMNDSEFQIAALRIPNSKRDDALNVIDFYKISPTKFK